MAEPRTWTGRSRGGVWLFRICARLLPMAGQRGAWLGSLLVAPFFLLLGGSRQFGLASYWRRLRPEQARTGLWLLAWRHYAAFGRVLCDRLLAWQDPASFRMGYLGEERFKALLARRQGVILLSAHVGNWELSTWWLHELELPPGSVHLVMVRDDLPEVQAFVDARMRGPHIAVHDPRDGLGTALAMQRALADGEVVCLLGDRLIPGQPSVEVRFLGSRVRMPLGPFHAAAVTGAPIVVCFLMKTGLGSYRFELDEPFTIALPQHRADRGAVLAAAAQRWASRLERQVRRQPFQWHNFYDFWAAARPEPQAPRRPLRR